MQSGDGGWRARSFVTELDDLSEEDKKRLGQGRAEFEIAMTGLSLLAFVSAGHTTHEGEHTETVQRGAQFLTERIVDYGRFETTATHYMYSHAIATQALCELYAYTADPYIGIAAQLCVDFLAYAQDPKEGGWRYEAKQRGDTSVTGWVVMALNSAYKARLDVAGFRSALSFLDGVTHDGYYRVGYVSKSDGGTNRLGSVGSLIRLFLTGRVDDSRITLNAERMLRQLPQQGREDFYYWYYGTLVMFQVGGRYWEAWNAALVPTLLGAQVSKERSPFTGSWPPRGDWSGEGGRIYQTALGVLMLTTYYRYDRQRTPRVHPYSGDVSKEARPFLELLREDTDDFSSAVTERKMIDQFGPALVPELVRTLRAEGEEQPFRRRLARALVLCAAPRHESVLLALLEEEQDHLVAEHVVRALESVSSVRSVPALVKHLKHGRAQVRAYAAEALGRIGDPQAAEALAARLAEEKDGNTRKRIEGALVKLAHRESIALVLDDALAPEHPGRLRIQERLALFESSGLAKLLLARRDEERVLYRRILEAIREHEDGAPIPVLLVALESDDLDTRAEANKLLVALTKVDHKFDPAGDDSARRQALNRWAVWWREHFAEFGAEED